MLPRVALEYGQSWCARLIRSRPCSRVSCGASRSSAAARPKPPLFERPDPDACRDPRVAQVELPPRRDPKQRALETGGVADGEQLLGIRPRPARAAHLTGNIERDIHTAVARPRMPLTATDGGRLGGVEDLESVVHVRPFVRPRDSGAAFFSSGGARGHGSQPGTARRFLAAGRPTAPAPPRQTGGPLGARELGTRDRGARAASAHLRARGASRLHGHRPTALAAIHNSTTAGSSSGRRALSPMPRPLATARVSLSPARPQAAGMKGVLTVK